MSPAIVNPTLRLRCSAAGCEAIWLTRRTGPRQRTLSARAGSALLQISQGRAPAELLDAGALAWLAAEELLVDPPPPSPRLALPRLARAPVAPDMSGGTASPDPDFDLVHEAGEARLEERAPWGGVWTVHPLSAGLAAAHAAALAGAAIDPEDAAPLLACGALASAAAREHRRARLLQWRAAGQGAYARAGFAVLPDWPPPPELAALQRYAGAVLERGYLDGDFGVAGKLRSHVFDDPALRPLHARAAGLARALTGRPLVPSYSFLSFYHQGGGLPAHRDKSHCVASMSVALLASAAWPLLLTDRDGARGELRWSTGQTLLFDGRRYAHARPPLAEPTAIHLVLHFQTDPEALP